jgi:predicted molibdopterin-dependent oxidoreductase YjgC
MPDHETVTLSIDGRQVTVPQGTTLLKAAHEAGIEVPHICYHDALTPPAVCRVCVVEVEGARTLAASCVAECGKDMTVHTRSEKVETSRRTILEMLHSAVNLDEAPEIQAMMGEYKADPARFPAAERRHHAIIDDNPFYLRDYDQCVLCWRCVQVCADDAQYAFALNFNGRGFETSIATFFDAPLPDSSCVFCGQCVGVCPTGALKPKVQWGMEQGLSADEIRKVTRRRKKREENAE